jgi:hypothetical protein
MIRKINSSNYPTQKRKKVKALRTSLSLIIPYLWPKLMMKMKFKLDLI